MKKKVGYPLTTRLLVGFGYNPHKVLERGFGPFRYSEGITPSGKKIRRWHKPILGQIAYLVSVYERFHNYH